MTTNELIAEASGVVAKALYEAGGETNCGPGWINRLSRRDRIDRYKMHHGIPLETPDELVLLAIIEDWDVD